MDQSQIPPTPVATPENSPVDNAGRRLYKTGAVIVLVVSILIVAASVLLMLKALWLFFVAEIRHPEEHGSLAILLEPLELGFLAPLPYLIYNGACRMLADMFPHPYASSVFADIKEATERNLEISKGLIAALIIGVFATDLLRRGLSENGLSKDIALAHATVIIALTGFIWVVKPRHP